MKQIISQETHDWSKQYHYTATKEVVLDLAERVLKLERQLLLLSPTPEDLNKYPALANAYREYRIIETLTIGKTDETS